jgi:hypothetical protein
MENNTTTLYARRKQIISMISLRVEDYLPDNWPLLKYRPNSKPKV